MLRDPSSVNLRVTNRTLLDLCMQVPGGAAARHPGWGSAREQHARLLQGHDCGGLG